MYKDGPGYKYFVLEEQFNGTLGSLIEEIIEAFVNEKIGQSKLGEFYNIAGVVTLEDYGDFDFNIGMDITFNEGEVLEEEVIRVFITERLLNRVITKVRCRNQLLDRAAYEKIKLDKDSNIKATYTLAYS